MRGRQRIIYSLNYYVELIGRLRGKFGFFEGPQIFTDGFLDCV